MLGKGEKKGLIKDEVEESGGDWTDDFNTMGQQLLVLLYVVINQSEWKSGPDGSFDVVRRKNVWSVENENLTILNQKCGAAGTMRGEISWSSR